MKTDADIRSEYDFLIRVISQNDDCQAVVLGGDGQPQTPYPEHLSQLIPVLAERIPELEETGSCKLVRRRGGSVYRINGLTDRSFGEPRFVFYITRNYSSSDSGIITHYEPEEILDDVEGSVFGITHSESMYEREMADIMSKPEPVLISGEIGIGKDHMAKTIFLRSRTHRHQFVVINCLGTDPRNWNSLIRREDSPLYDVGNTIFIQNIDALSYDQTMQLLTVIGDSRCAEFNRIVISCSEQRALTPEKNNMILRTINRLHCQVLFMKPLRGQDMAIRNSVRLMLDHLSKRYTYAMGMIQPQALNDLVNFAWPQNIEQLKRVMEKLVVAAGDGTITTEHVSSVLSSEAGMVQAENGATGSSIIDLNRPLSEIERDIVELVLTQTGGNQTEAAKRLGIGRSTLWRLRKEQDRT
ncbi:MAG: sigma 54-interacting transcriptional regulator [Oscillospiraceae bacterium]|nr:sigma 54-interacting transcriptional regulator [Oscillospiraceae bacterium]